MAHKEPRQIERFVKKFSDLPFDFYIHIDKKISLETFEYLTHLPQVQFARKRFRVRWASYNFLHAELETVKEILGNGIPYDYISVMSGQDYPVRPPENLIGELEKNKGKNFICYDETEVWWTHAISRINRYHFTNFGFPGRYKLQSLLNAMLPLRKLPMPFKLFGGPKAMCMSLTIDCAAYVVQFLESNKKFRQFIKFTWGPDEFVIPTIIMNSKFKSSVINNNFYYIDWSKGGASPRTLTVNDYDRLLSSGKLLARKFDIRYDADILDMLDKN